MRIIGFVLVALLCFSFTPSDGLCEGNIDALKEYEYWADGKIRGCKVYDSNGRIRTRSFCRPD